MPEIVVAAIAARNGQGNVVAGHVLGACLFNLLFIVGGMAALRPLPLPASFVRLELPAAMASRCCSIHCSVATCASVARRCGAGLVFAAWLAFELFGALH